MPGQVCAGGVRGKPFVTMEGNVVFKFAVKVLAEVVEEVMAAAALPIERIDWLIPHQANIRIIEATARKLGLPMEKVVVTVDRHANTSAASIPLALDEAVGAGVFDWAVRVHGDSPSVYLGESPRGEWVSTNRWEWAIEYQAGSATQIAPGAGRNHGPQMEYNRLDFLSLEVMLRLHGAL